MVRFFYREPHGTGIDFGRLAFGVGCWNGKPQFSARREWHDGPIYVLHLGPFWAEWDYPSWGNWKLY